MNDYNHTNTPGGQPPAPQSYPGNYAPAHTPPQQDGYPHSPAPASGHPTSYHNAHNSDGWNYAGQYYNYQHDANSYASYPPPPPQPPKRKRGGALGVVSLILACALFGFGGGYAAVSLYSARDAQTVVYKDSEAGQTARGVTNAEDFSVSDIAAKAGASVVSITTENLVADYFTGGRVVSGAGSGVIISADGTIITNNHVVEGAQNIRVTLPDGSDHEAELLGRDPYSDIAVVKINVTNLTPAVIANSDELQVGEFCLAIGNPMGTLGGTVTDGIISATNREITIDGVTMNLLQMSAAVSPGNSGGGLFNAKGELIGIVNAKNGSSEAEGLGFAIPINSGMQVAQSLIENGSVPGRPAIGISGQAFSSAEEAAALGFEGFENPGVYVMLVTPGAAADQAGLLVGDRIASVDGVEMLQMSDLTGAINAKKVGETLELVVERGGKQMNITIKLQERVLE